MALPSPKQAPKPSGAQPLNTVRDCLKRHHALKVLRDRAVEAHHLNEVDNLNREIDRTLDRILELKAAA
jgi:hypothetical protein